MLAASRERARAARGRPRGGRGETPETGAPRIMLNKVTGNVAHELYWLDDVIATVARDGWDSMKPPSDRPNPRSDAVTPILIFAMVSILIAAVVYTVAVFAERRAGVLRPWHLALFWIGLVFDTTGTTLMSKSRAAGSWDVHGVTGAAAIVLMLVHSVWATIALTLKQDKVLHQFHKFSIFVWVLWMVALVSGFGMVALGIGVPT